MEIGDGGGYTENQYTAVDTFWNSAMIESSRQDETRDSDAMQTKQHDRLPDSNDPPHDVEYTRQIRSDARITAAGSRPLPSLPTSSSENTEASPNPLQLSIPSTHDDNIDTHSSFAASTRTTSPNPIFTGVDLTWNSALTSILASPYVDPCLSAAIRSCTSSRQKGRDEEVDMHDARMVPNFSFPIAGARWSERCESVVDEEGQDNQTFEVGIETRDDCDAGTLEPKILKGENQDKDGSSLYRVPTPRPIVSGSPDIESVLGKVLQPAEVDMY